MIEPDWSALGPEYYDKPAGVGSLVWTFRRTRGRFGAMTPAVPGDHGLVISRWISSMGSEKLSFITADLREVATTASCARLWGSLNSQCTSKVEQSKWSKVKLNWMNETFVPIFVTREKTTSRKTPDDRNRHRMISESFHQQLDDFSRLIIVTLDAAL